jgi:hypothetical protein
MISTRIMRGFWRDAEKARPTCGAKYALPLLLMRRCERTCLTVLRSISLIALRRTSHRIFHSQHSVFVSWIASKRNQLKPYAL